MDKNKRNIRILIMVVVILALAVVYAFLIRPALNGYVVDKQVNAYNQGYITAWNDIYTQLNQQGYAQFPVEDKVLVIQGQVQILQKEALNNS